MENPFSSELFRRHSQADSSSESMQHFVQVPSVFYQALTPAQYQAMQQFYQVAYEQARSQIKNTDPVFGEADLGFGI